MSVNTVKFTPSGLRALIEPIEETIGNHGLIIPESCQGKDPTTRKGKVIAVSKKLTEIQVGDVVIYENYAVDVEIESKEYKLVHVEYIQGVFDEDDKSDRSE